MKMMLMAVKASWSRFNKSIFSHKVSSAIDHATDCAPQMTGLGSDEDYYSSEGEEAATDGDDARPSRRKSPGAQSMVSILQLVRNEISSSHRAQERIRGKLYRSIRQSLNFAAGIFLRAVLACMPGPAHRW